MSALTSIKLRKKGETTPFCEMPDCSTKGKADWPTYANEQLFLLDHPLGWYCRKHANEIRAAYESAHGTFEPEELAA